MILKKVCNCLRENNIDYAIVGGYAVALHGAPRGTFDVDLVISHSEESFIAVEKALESIGLKSRLPVSAKEVFQFRKEYIEHRNLIAWSFINPGNALEIIDIIITDNLDDNLAVQKKIGAEQIWVLSKKDLIKMKRRSGRQQDLEDIRALGGVK